MGKRAAVDVFRFTDYRAFLRAYYERRKSQRGGISLRGFSRKVGLKSPNYLKLVMDGDRNLSPQLALRFAQACGLEADSADYFCTLVACNQAKTSDERALHHARLKGFRRYRETHRLALAQDAYHAHWYIPAVRELSARRDFSEDPAWIARTLLPPIKASEAKRALGVLTKLGLMVRDATGRLRQADALVETAPGPLSHQVVGYHRAMLRLSARALEDVPRDEREISSLTLCVRHADLAALKSEIERFQVDLLQRYGDIPDAQRVVQINMQMFPLSSGEE
ncbi:MAG: TIGR02147 family protein [Myxococcales bacterium]|nr:TIGR02147 family protein [Myxococcales bacterium]MDD9966709.1 TIGR02147 family protein [Myxococcales bacterium]